MNGAVRLVEASGFPIPPLGIIGPKAVREAFNGDLQQLRDLLQGAIKKALELSGEEDWWPYIHAIFQDFIVVEAKDGKLLKYNFSVDGTTVALGTPQEVVKRFVPADEQSTEGSASFTESTAFLEAAEGGSFRIRVIEAGLSGNGNFYPADVLRQAVPLFEGVRVFVKSDQEHLSGQGKAFTNLIGGLQNVSFVESNDGGEIQADLVLIQPDGDIATKLREAISQNLTSLFGFSIDAMSLVKPRNEGGRAIREATRFTNIKSVDLIVEPGAGGTLLNLIEAQAEGDPLMDREEIMNMLEGKGFDRQQLSAMNDGELKATLREALGNPESSQDPEQNADFVTRDELRMVETRAEARTTIQDSGLPAAAQSRLIDRFTTETGFSAQTVREAIQSERDYLAQFTGGGHVAGLGDGQSGTGQHQVFAGETEDERNISMLEACLDTNHQDHRQASSFKECYVSITGDKRVTGQLRDCHSGTFREALQTTSFSLALGETMNRRLLADYRTASSEDTWRRVANVGNLNDFREQRRARLGGFGDLPIVNENNAYTELNGPTEEEAKFKAEKRGGTRSITMEMIKNDDVNLIRRIPIKMSGTAKRTLSRFVFGFIIDNPVIYDAKALFHADHNNLGTAALSEASYSAARLRMVNQTEPGSNEKLMINPKTLLVPTDLGETAYNMFRRDTNNDENFIQSMRPDIVEVWCFTDETDWSLVADPNMHETIEIGFMDGNQEPEMFVQDSPTAGSVFTHDRITYKLRHIYGGGVTDYRSFQKNVVAG